MRGDVRNAMKWIAPVVLLGACGGPLEPVSESEAPEAAMPGTPAPVTPTEEAQAQIAPPPATDSAWVARGGTVAMGGAVQASCGSRPGYDGYTLQATAGTQVRLEVTHAGSSMYLDTGLFLYGPKDANGGYAGPVLFQDDDSGYGELSRIDVATLPTSGEYLVVVGWGNAAGKKYRLQVDCVGGTCVTQPPPAPSGHTLTLLEQPLAPGLQTALDAANTWREDQYAYLRRFDFAWPYTGAAALEQAASAVLAMPLYAGYRADPAPETFAYAQLPSRMYSQYQSLHPALLSTYGRPPETVQVRSSFRRFSTGPNGDHWRTLNVILLPSAYKVLVYEQTGHEI
ncbi:hypothetical protein I3V78_34770 [Archangium primigenium]|nr:hypothetical protein [Archangium primigenium]